MSNAIAAHEPARERSMDIGRVKDHLLRVFSDTIARIKEPVLPFEKGDAQFLFAGYSWLQKDFRIWTIYYSPNDRSFGAREALNFHPRLRKAAFIGDWAKRIRSSLVRQLGDRGDPTYLDPLRILAETLRNSGRDDTVGGPPQLVRITQHMNTRPLCVKWEDEDTLFGRPLFDYENTDYWIVEPFTGKILRPRKFGYREKEVSAQDNDDAPALDSG